MHVYFSGGWRSTRVFQLAGLGAGDVIAGPAMLVDKTQTLLVGVNCNAILTSGGSVEISVPRAREVKCSPPLIPVISATSYFIATEICRNEENGLNSPLHLLSPLHVNR